MERDAGPCPIGRKAPDAYAFAGRASIEIAAAENSDEAIIGCGIGAAPSVLVIGRNIEPTHPVRVECSVPGERAVTSRAMRAASPCADAFDDGVAHRRLLAGRRRSSGRNLFSVRCALWP